MMETDDRRVDRRVRNELVFRAVNQKLRELNIQFEGFANELAVFVCECDRLECIAQIEIAVDAFDRVSAEPRQYVVVNGHEGTVDGERVVEKHDGYVVVEKNGSRGG